MYKITIETEDDKVTLETNEIFYYKILFDFVKLMETVGFPYYEDVHEFLTNNVE